MTEQPQHRHVAPLRFEPGQSTSGPAVKVTADAGLVVVHPDHARLLGIDLIGAAYVAEYESALTQALREHEWPDDTAIDAVIDRTRELMRPLLPPAEPEPAES